MKEIKNDNRTKIEKIQDSLDELMEDNFIDESLQKKIRVLIVKYVIEARKNSKKELLDKFFKCEILNVNEYNSEIEMLEESKLF